MVDGYATGGLIRGEPLSGVGYDPDSDGPLLAPASRDKYQAALERINRDVPTEEE